MIKNRFRFAVTLPAIALLIGACSSSDDPTLNTDGNLPAPIEIKALDELRFEPATVTVTAGIPVTFNIENTGKVMHEWVLGPESVHQAHEDAAGAGMTHGGMEVEGQLAALEIEPGTTKSVTVTFETAGEVLFGCHVVGHYGAGMKGSVTATS